jgi:hypothetical protein
MTTKGRPVANHPGRRKETAPCRSSTCCGKVPGYDRQRSPRVRRRRTPQQPTRRSEPGQDSTRRAAPQQRGFTSARVALAGWGKRDGSVDTQVCFGQSFLCPVLSGESRMASGKKPAALTPTAYTCNSGLVVSVCIPCIVVSRSGTWSMNACAHPGLGRGGGAGGLARIPRRPLSAVRADRTAADRDPRCKWHHGALHGGAQLLAVAAASLSLVPAHGPAGRRPCNPGASRLPPISQPPPVSYFAPSVCRVFDSLTEEQKNRYEVFMRSSLPKPKMKKVGPPSARVRHHPSRRSRAV